MRKNVESQFLPDQNMQNFTLISKKNTPYRQTFKKNSKPKQNENPTTKNPKEEVGGRRVGRSPLNLMIVKTSLKH